MSYNKAVELFRDDEYPMMKENVYLDHSGTTIYCKSLIEQFSEKLVRNLYGNPHSNSDPARLSSEVVEMTREAALRFFGADSEHFDLIFTANATAAIKLVGECFQDLASSDNKRGAFFYGYHRDAHTSLVGIRELTGGTHHCFASDADVEDWLNGRNVNIKDSETRSMPGLFAYPGQSNMTGRRLPLSWPGQLRTSPTHQNIYSLLDAAALSTTTKLDLSDPNTAPDFTALSFYKIFGFPDLGALIVRKKSGHILKWKRYFGGGTISMLTVHDNPSVQRREVLHEALEEGTLPFHSIIALGCAMETHQRLYGSMTAISQHTSFLVQRLYRGMSKLQHDNGRAICVIYNDPNRGEPYSNPKTQGATIAFNIVRENGSYFDYSHVEKLANDVGIFVRSGGLCNAGGIAHYLNIQPWQWKRNWSAGFRCGGGEGTELIINEQPTGVVRASLGAMSTISDVDIFLDFLASTFRSRPASANPSEGLVSEASRSTALSRAEHWVELSNHQNGSKSPTVSPAISVFESSHTVPQVEGSMPTASKPFHTRMPSKMSLNDLAMAFKSKKKSANQATSGFTSNDGTTNVREVQEHSGHKYTTSHDTSLPNLSFPPAKVDSRSHPRNSGLTSKQSTRSLAQISMHSDSNTESRTRGVLRGPTRLKSWMSNKSSGGKAT